MFAIAGSPETAWHLGAHRGFGDHFERFCRDAGSCLLFGYCAFILRSRGEDAPIGNCGIFRTFRGLSEDFDGQPGSGWIPAPIAPGKA